MTNIDSRRGVSRPISEIWKTLPDPTSVPPKPISPRRFPVFRAEWQNVARSVHFYSLSGPGLAYTYQEEEFMSDKTALHSRRLRVVSAAALGVALAVLAGP